jgi:hypothetical protein
MLHSCASTWYTAAAKNQKLALADRNIAMPLSVLLKLLLPLAELRPLHLLHVLLLRSLLGFQWLTQLP